MNSNVTIPYLDFQKIYDEDRVSFEIKLLRSEFCLETNVFNIYIVSYHNLTDRSINGFNYYIQIFIS
jgi:hypothetical protein